MLISSTKDIIKDLIPDPKWIVSQLDKIIIGQTQAKEVLAMAVVIRGLIFLQRTNKIHSETQFTKSNLLLLGNTGTGKTSLIKALSKVTGIPIYIKDLTGLTSGAWYGSKLEDSLKDYVSYIVNFYSPYYFNSYPEHEAAQVFKHTVETGMIYFDEIDKLAFKDEKKNSTHSTIELQNELLKYLENGVISVRMPQGLFEEQTGIYEPNKSDLYMKLDMTRVTVVGGGAFSGIDQIVEHRLKDTKGGIGFTSDPKLFNIKKDRLLNEVNRDDLQAYGFKKEFIGRFAIIVALDPLSVEVVTKIILESETSPLKEFVEFFRLFGITLSLSDEAVSTLAEYICDLNVGARGITTALRQILRQHMYDIYSSTESTLVITKQDVVKEL